MRKMGATAQPRASLVLSSRKGESACVVRSGCTRPDISSHEDSQLMKERCGSCLDKTEIAVRARIDEVNSLESCKSQDSNANKQKRYLTPRVYPQLMSRMHKVIIQALSYLICWNVWIESTHINYGLSTVAQISKKIYLTRQVDTTRLVQ